MKFETVVTRCCCGRDSLKISIMVDWMGACWGEGAHSRKYGNWPWNNWALVVNSIYMTRLNLRTHSRIIPTDSIEAHPPTPRYGQYLTHAHSRMNDQATGIRKKCERIRRHVEAR